MRAKKTGEEDDGGLFSACHRSQSQTESGLYNYGLSPHQLREEPGEVAARSSAHGVREARGRKEGEGSYTRSAVFSSNCVLSSFAFGFRVSATVSFLSEFLIPLFSRKIFVSHRLRRIRRARVIYPPIRMIQREKVIAYITAREKPGFKTGSIGIAQT